MSAPENTLAVVFDNHPVAAVMWRGRAAWVAAQVGAALGYPVEGQRFTTKVTGEWAGEFILGTDFEVLTNGVLAEFKSLHTETVSSRATSLVILYEPGLHLALLKTRKPAGRRLRRVLADLVLPQLRATGTATLPGAPAPAVLPAPVAAQLPAPKPAPKQLPAPVPDGADVPITVAVYDTVMSRLKRIAKARGTTPDVLAGRVLAIWAWQLSTLPPAWEKSGKC